MGFFDLNWKGKSKATSSSTTNTSTSIFSRFQQTPPPHSNEAEASSSMSTSSAKCSKQETSKAGKASPKSCQVKETSGQCKHKTHCHLNTYGCCACVDRRPLNSVYVTYKDGRGLVADGTRWCDYCPGCKGLFYFLWASDIPCFSLVFWSKSSRLNILLLKRAAVINESC